MMNRLICGCLRDRQALKHHRHEEAQAAGVAHLSDDDEMAVVELPPLPAKSQQKQRRSSAEAAQKQLAAVALTSKSAAAVDEDLLQPQHRHHQPQHQPTKAEPPASAAPSPRSPAAPAPPSPAPSPCSPGPEEAASPSRFLSRTVVASPPPASAVSSPSASTTTRSSTTKPPTPANATWAKAWALMVREQQQVEAQEKAKQEFVAALGKGIAALKHDRRGHARVRELYTPDGGQSFCWRNPHKKKGKDKAGHRRGKSSAGGGGGGVFERGRAFHEILEVRRGTVPDPSTGGEKSGTATLRASCPKSDLFKSFSLILKDRTVDFTCHSIEQMTYLVKGITTLMAEQKRALLKARAAEAPASPGRMTAAY